MKIRFWIAPFVALGAAPLAAQAPTLVLVPILDMKSGYLLGGSRGGKWIDPKTTAKGLKNGQNYRVFSAMRSLGNGKATLPKSQGAPCEETLFSQVSPDFGEKAEFALGGTHNPLRRAFRVENPNQAIYRSIVAEILRKNGIVKPEVKITQIWRVDLDGDGSQEVLLSATRKADGGNTDGGNTDGGNANSIAPASRAGDYSLLLLRRLVRGKVENQLIEGESHPRVKEFNAPGFYRLGAVFDANGDGRMELLVRGRYYEGEWTSLYGFQGTKAKEVLVEGCGA